MAKLLLVDDSKTFIKVLRRILENKYTIIGQAHDGGEGIERYKELSPDLVLLDITMPNVNGKDCLRGILSLNPSAKVIMVSSLDDQQTVSECLSLGAVAFIAKESITLQELNAPGPLLHAVESAVGADYPGLEAL
ncbi:MAG: response regulator [Bdellovibrionales bacterium]